jgi:hypothetical protein
MHNDVHAACAWWPQGHSSGVNSTAAINHTKKQCPPNNRGQCSDDQLFSVSGHSMVRHSRSSPFTLPSAARAGWQIQR